MVYIYTYLGPRTRLKKLLLTSVDVHKTRFAMAWQYAIYRIRVPIPRNTYSHVYIIVCDVCTLYFVNL